MKEKEELKNLRDQGIAQLYKKLGEYGDRLRKVYFEAARGEIKNHRQVRLFKKRIAQIKTILREKGEEIITRKEQE